VTDPARMHRVTAESERLVAAVMAYIGDCMRIETPPLEGPPTPAELTAAVGETITAEGLGGEAVLDLFRAELATSTISVENPRFLAFIPTAPTYAAKLFDMAVTAATMYGGSWRAGAGAVYAENQALRWLADLAGLPQTAGGCFVQGGTIGNLSALVAARHAFLTGRETRPPGRLRLATTDQVHASVATAADVMDAELLGVAADGRGRLTGAALEETLARDGGEAVFAVVATAGTTNLGIIDDLAGIAEVCAARNLWLHVDAAYGGAALAAPSARPKFAGIEACDSLIIDPHKWLYAPIDSCALLYRRPDLALPAHTQHAGYLDAARARVTGDWNPSDYAIHLTRRARGLPFWFSLATHGTRAYSEAIEHSLAVAREARADIERRPYLELVHEPSLSVLCMRRVGWEPDDYRRWSARLLADGVGVVTPTEVSGETVTRICVVNPRTTAADVAAILDTMA
jgi:glutamate/tyrosine decarboxylase-like PLP-dependent enzyme